ncbi:MAG: protein kinase [Myxococcales bacterium]|nr:protein kinase [Myxococcales bacterium]
MADAAADRIGQVIDSRYKIVELIGEGGMGAVFAAEHLKLRKQVALKIIRAEFASNSLAEARFAREATATSRLDHPHVASAIDYGSLPDGGLYLVIQLVRGQGLARRMEAGRLPWREAAELGAQIADALAAAHAAGIVHRDLKPDNILVESRADGKLHVKVVDFGIARLSEESVDGTLKPLTRMGAIIGTPGYMAPEQAVGEAVDARGDLYALGVILWECCAGKRLWAGEDLVDLIARQLGSVPPTLAQECGAAVPAALSELVAQLLASAPSLRPQSAAAVHEALRGLLSGPTPGTTAPSLATLVASTSTTALPLSIMPARQRRWTTVAGKALHGRRWPVFAGVAALVTIGLLLALSGDRDELVAAGDEPAADSPAEAPAEASPPVAAKVEPAEARPVEAKDTTPGADAAPGAEAPAPVVGAEAGEGSPAGEDEDEPDEELEPESEPAPPVAALPGAKPVPPALTDAVTTLAGSTRKARKRAAARVIAWKPKADVPLFALNIAWLEKAGSCGNKRAVLEKIEADGDPRALPALRRLSRVRRSGCGWFNAQDCLGCLRGTLSHAMAFLEGRAAAKKQ